MSKITVLVDDAAPQEATEAMLGPSRSASSERLRLLDTEVLKNSAKGLLTEFSKVFADLKAVGDFKLSEVAVAVSVNAEGGFVLIGKAGVTGGITLKFEP